MDNDFKKRLLDTFRDETKEHLAAISSGLIELEKNAGSAKQQSVLETVFREAHSLKGAARAVNMAGIEEISHALEGVFSGFKRQEVLPSPILFDLLHRATDMIAGLLNTAETDQNTGDKIRIREIIARLQHTIKGAALPPPPPLTPPPADQQNGTYDDKATLSDSIRISSWKLDFLLHQGEEMLTVKQASLQRSMELRELESGLSTWEKEWEKVRPVLKKLRKRLQPAAGQTSRDTDTDQLATLLAFCDWSHDTLKALGHKTQVLTKTAAHDRHVLDEMVDNLVGGLKEALMLPCSTILGVLPKMARDLARERGKNVDLVIAGDTVEIDKRILEQMKDPMIHLLRNSIDHGIENPEERIRLGKPSTGTVYVTVSLKAANQIEIVVADDGGGIDGDRVMSTAKSQGIIPRDQANRPDMKDIMDLLFTSGFSTAPLITDISGRGLGLAIVREKVENLGGTVTVASAPQSGATFRMTLPLTMSTYHGVLVAAGDQTFIVPAAGVERVARIDGASLKTVENRDTIELDDEAVSFVRLTDILQLRRKETAGHGTGLIPLFVVRSGASRIAFGVDAVLDEQEVQVKGLGPQLSRVRNIAGATVLGTGRVVAILHPGDLVKSAISGSTAPSVAHPIETSEAARRSVLVVEDSITARTLLKNILETAGYRTTTAVDGIDAMTQLKTKTIDLVVSDVDMPRMNGFDLTAKIRASREFGGLPVVLVTSLDSREDRERGIDAGANAYIVKSSFDQSNLLEAIKRLI